MWPGQFLCNKGRQIHYTCVGIHSSFHNNKSFMQLARDMGLEVEQRHITVDELETIEEAAACGTAAVASPVGEIDDLDTGKKYIISKDGNPGPVTTELYNRLRGIQYGEIEDPYGWCTIVE